MINILSLHRGISGSFINLLDYADVIGKYSYGYFYFNIDYKLMYRYIKETRRIYKNIKFKKFDNFIECDILLTDYISLVKTVNNGIRTKCNKLIVFDNLELTLHLRNIKENYYYQRFSEIISKPIYFILEKHMIKNVKFLITPFIYDEFTNKYGDIETVEYCKKINLEALSTIQYNDNNKKFSREFITHEIDVINDFSKVNIFNYHTYCYKRRKTLSYIEQFGRLVFEFLLLGKEVELYDDKKYNDGLEDYLRLNLEKLIIVKNDLDIIID